MTTIPTCSSVCKASLDVLAIKKEMDANGENKLQGLRL